MHYNIILWEDGVLANKNLLYFGEHLVYNSIYNLWDMFGLGTGAHYTEFYSRF